MSYNLDELQRHLEGHWQAAARRIKWELGPTEKLHPDFRVLELEPGQKHNCWIYSTLEAVMHWWAKFGVWHSDVATRVT